VTQHTDTVTQHTHDDGDPCDVAHGDASQDRTDDRRLVVVYATPLAQHLLTWGRELGFATVLVEPDPTRVTHGHLASADTLVHVPGDLALTADTDVVVTDHHRDDLGPVMAPLVTAGPRWIGIIGSPRHAGPHGAALAAEGVAEASIATVQRPIGLDIGSRSPAEIALSVLAGLLADRNGRPGGLPRVPEPQAG
jgi:xanthine dehydrogenase accessory factor